MRRYSFNKVWQAMRRALRLRRRRRRVAPRRSNSFKHRPSRACRCSCRNSPCASRGELALFDDPEVLDYPWELSAYDAAPTREELNALGLALKVSQGGEIDVDDESGKVTMRFIAELQRDLGLAYRPEHWDEIK